MKTRLLLLFACLLPQLALAAEPPVYPYDLAGKEILQFPLWETRAGDGAWEAGAGGEDWKTIRFNKTESTEAAGEAEGRFWLRVTLDLKGVRDDTDTVGIFFTHLPSAFEAYWDGVPVWRNGRVGSGRIDERLGRLRGVIPLPHGLVTAGRHHFSVRVSNFHVGKKDHDFEFLFSYITTLNQLVTQRKEENFLYLGLFQTALLFALFLFLGGWRYFPALFLCLFTFSRAVDNLWYILQRSNLLPIPLFYGLKDLIEANYLISSLPLNLFIVWHLDIGRKKALTAALAGFSALQIFVYLRFDAYLWQPEMAVSFAILALILRQLRRRRVGSGTALAGYGVYAAFFLAYHLAEHLPFLSFIRSPYVTLVPNSIFLVMLMGSVTLKLREQFHALAALRYRSERLEAELLKKSIQPHFIMNTLLSIKSYLGIDSAKAERLIEALAEEFRLVSRISKQAEIPLEEELSLCRLHLELMGYRRDARYELAATGDCRGLSIPPMVLHTLVENGLTHAFKPKENGKFRFSCARDGRKTILRLENDGADLGGRLKDSARAEEEGLGLRYVRARLEEAYPGRWRLECGAHQGAWVVQIEIEAP